MDRNTAEVLWWEPAEQEAERERLRRRAERRRRAEKERRAQLRRRKRKRQLLFFGGQCIVFVAAVLLLVNIGNNYIWSGSIRSVLTQGEEKDGWNGADAGDTAEKGGVWNEGGEAGGDYPDLCAADAVDRPVKRESWEVTERLGELAGDYPLIARILEEPERYTGKLLEALANNPEMADFVAGYPESSGQRNGGLTESEREQKYPLFLQWDPRWGYVSYGDDSNVGLAGCGPACLSMALYYLTGNETLTPDKIAEYSMENGYYMSGTGTQWALMDDVPGLYGQEVSRPGISPSIMKRELDAGRIIICAMRPGDFTASGHFIVIYGYDGEGFRVNDPNCVARSRQKWPFETIQGQIKQLWSVG